VVVYFDDNLLYNKSLHEHLGNFHVVLSILRGSNLFANKRSAYFVINGSLLVRLVKSLGEP